MIEGDILIDEDIGICRDFITLFIALSLGYYPFSAKRLQDHGQGTLRDPPFVICEEPI
jgi:hypothetical protein